MDIREDRLSTIFDHSKEWSDVRVLFCDEKEALEGYASFVQRKTKEDLNKQGPENREEVTVCEWSYVYLGGESAKRQLLYLPLMLLGLYFSTKSEIRFQSYHAFSQKERKALRFVASKQRLLSALSFLISVLAGVTLLLCSSMWYLNQGISDVRAYVYADVFALILILVAVWVKKSAKRIGLAHDLIQISRRKFSFEGFQVAGKNVSQSVE